MYYVFFSPVCIPYINLIPYSMTLFHRGYAFPVRVCTSCSFKLQSANLDNISNIFDLPQHNRSQSASDISEAEARLDVLYKDSANLDMRRASTHPHLIDKLHTESSTSEDSVNRAHNHCNSDSDSRKDDVHSVGKFADPKRADQLKSHNAACQLECVKTIVDSKDLAIYDPFNRTESQSTDSDSLKDSVEPRLYETVTELLESVHNSSQAPNTKTPTQRKIRGARLSRQDSMLCNMPLPGEGRPLELDSLLMPQSLANSSSSLIAKTIQKFIDNPNPVKNQSTPENISFMAHGDCVSGKLSLTPFRLSFMAQDQVWFKISLLTIYDVKKIILDALVSPPSLIN